MTHPSKNITGPHRQNLYLIVVCLVVLAAAFLLTISKDLRTRKQLETQLAEASELADRYQSLTPLMAELQKNDEAPMPEYEGFSDQPALPDASAEDYEAAIEKVLQQFDLKQTALVPDIQSILSDRDYILVDMTVRGAFSNFRDLILQVGRLPFISGIERFRVQRLSKANELEMFLQLRIDVVSRVDSLNEDQ